MLIAYPPPALNTVALTNATWAGTTSGKLTDGQPATLARLTTSGTPSITLTFASAFVPRVIPLLGLRGAIAAGDIVTATTGAGGALGGNSASQAVVQLPDGSLACWIITGGTVSTTTVKITINRTGTLDIGEVAAMPAVDLPIEKDWKEIPTDPSNLVRTRGGQLVARKLRAWRELPVVFALANQAAARGGGLANGMDWQKLDHALAGGARCAAIPRWKTPAGGIDAAELHRTAIYGVASMGETQHIAGPWYKKTAMFSEVPPI